LDSLHDLLRTFLFGFALAVNGCVSDVAERDAGLATQRSPDGPRQVKQHRLASEEKRYPLVVADVVAMLIHLRTVFVERQIMSVGRPAVLT